MIYRRSMVCGVGLLAAATAWAEPGGALDDVLNAAEPGQVIQAPQLGLSESGITILPMTRSDAPGPQFLLSDKPEYFRTGDGVALRERVEPGRVRLYLYHVPEPTGQEKVITATIDNLGDGPLTLRFTRYAFPKPGGNYRQIGKDALAAYFEGHAPQAVSTIAPGERMVIDPALDQAVVVKDQLVHTFHEFEIDQPALVRVFQRDPQADSLTIVDILPELPRVLEGWHPSGAGRGLFRQSEFHVAPTEEGYTYDTAEGPRQIIVADGRLDPWVTGRDSIAGTEGDADQGNYGTVYHIRIPYRTSDGRALALLAYNPRGDNQWCMTQSLAVKVNAGRFPAGVVMGPKDQTSYGRPPEAVLLQVYPVLNGSGQGVIELTYSPPGASCLPVGLVLTPMEPQ